MTVHSRYYPRLGSLSSRYVNSMTRDENRRRHARRPCSIPVDYTIDGHPFKGVIEDISDGGVLLTSDGGHFLVGQDISVSFFLPLSGKHIEGHGRIAWCTKKGIGARFNDMDTDGLEQELHDLEAAQKKTGVLDKKIGRIAGRPRRKKVNWQPSASSDVSSYRLYWSIGGQVGYDSDFVDLGNATELSLPDDIPALSQQTGDIQLGVTAVNQAGNESDMTKLNAFVDFRIPETPEDFEIEDI